MGRVCNIGPVTIELNGTGKAYELLSRELEASSVAQPSGEIDVELNIVAGKNFPHFEPKVFSAKGRLNFDATSYYVSEPFPFLVTNLFQQGRHTVIDVFPRVEPARFVRMVHRYLSSLESLYSSIMSYSFFWYLLNLVLLKKNCCFIHAAISERHDRVTALGGTGGCGKTSTLFKLLEDEDRKYMAEDFGIIGQNGKVYYNPKFVSIYASDTRSGQRVLIDCIRNKIRGFRALEWWLRRDVLRGNPRVKVPPREVLAPDRICKEADLTNVVFLIRHDTARARIVDISVEQLVERLLNVNLREMKTMLDHLHMIKANAPEEYKYPSVDEIVERTRTIYTGALAKVDRKLVIVPHWLGPAKLVEILKQEELV